MTVAEMVETLLQYRQDLEVKITDGFRYQFYEGKFDIALFEDVDGTQMVDIGIGGLDEDEE